MTTPAAARPATMGEHETTLPAGCAGDAIGGTTTMGARPFLDLLREHRGGATHDELSEALNEIVTAVSDTGKAGKLQLTINVKPHDEGTVMVLDEVKITKPKPVKGGNIFFVTPENNLQRSDPKQPDLPLREIGPALAAKALA